MKNLKYYLQESYKEHWAIGQFNFSIFEQVKGIVQAANNLNSPIILGTSEGESKFIGLAEAVAMRNLFREKTELPIFLNLDHGKSFDYLKEAILAGYDMVHFDGSKLPLDENIRISKQVVALAHKKKVLVEGEVGKFSKDKSIVYQEKFEIQEDDLTKVSEAKDYVRKTGVDMLAISIGTFHGVDIAGVSPHIELGRLKDINNEISIPLVLHGGSGTPTDDIKEAVKSGICKININTDIRMAFSNTLRKILQEDKDEITPYKYFPQPIEAVQKVTEQWIKLFSGSL